MQLIITSTPEANALRDAANAIQADHGAAARILRKRADDFDRAAALELAQAAQSGDTFGRWVRRVTSNAGPGVLGIGHIAVLGESCGRSAARTLCGRALVGTLAWGTRAQPRMKAPEGWRPCGTCEAEIAVASLRKRVAS